MAEYRPVKGFEGFYLVSDNGEVINARTGHVLRGSIKTSGYREVILTNGIDKIYPTVHRLVADAFCEKAEGHDEVNHINGDKLDNRAENLEWVDRAGNLAHAFATGLMPNDATPVAVVAKNIETGEETLFPSIYKAARFFGISQGNICMCCKGARPYASGYTWRYANGGE